MVTAFDGRPVSNFTQLTDLIRPLPPGTPVTITVRRDGKLVNLHTKLANVRGRSGSYLGVGPAVLFQVASPLRAIEYSGTTFGQVLVGSAQAVAALPGALPKLFAKNRSSTSAARSSAWSARPRRPAPRWPPTRAGSTRSASCCCSSPR